MTTICILLRSIILWSETMYISYCLHVISALKHNIIYHYIILLCQSMQTWIYIWVNNIPTPHRGSNTHWPLLDNKEISSLYSSGFGGSLPGICWYFVWSLKVKRFPWKLAWRGKQEIWPDHVQWQINTGDTELSSLQVASGKPMHNQNCDTENILVIGVDHHLVFLAKYST